MPEYEVEFVDTGESLQISDTRTLMRGMMDEGITGTEYSCRVGMCGACCYEIMEGEVTQPAAHMLPEEQRDEYALTCMARPQSDLKLRRGFPPTIENDAAGSELLEDEDPFEALDG